MRCKFLLAIAVPLAVFAAACGEAESSAARSRGGTPKIVVTTTVLGDVVRHLAGDLANVETIMPADAIPHEFQASARQAAVMRQAEALIVNGAGFEEGMHDAIEAAESDGVPTLEAIEGVKTIDFGEQGAPTEEEDDEEHAGVDPHFFTDPARMAVAAESIAEFLSATVPELDTNEFRQQAATYREELRALDGDIEAILGTIPTERRRLVTNHEVFAYFADRYGFVVVGAVIPGGGTQGEPSAAQLDELANTIQAEGVPAIFVETSAPDRVARALASEVGDVELVELFTESLGSDGSPGDTYAGMMRTNAERIAEALGQ